jgi:hypothetical protein
MPLPRDLANRTARQRYMTRLLPMMIAQTDDVDPAYLVALAVCPDSPSGARVLGRLEDVLGAGNDREPSNPPVVFRWAPHDSLAEILRDLGLGTPAQHESLTREGAESQGRAAWVLDDGRVELVSVEIDDTATREYRRERIQRENLDQAGIRLDELPRRSALFAVGSAEDPNEYLPAPWPVDWVRETESTAVPQRVLVRDSVRADIGVIAMARRRRVFALVRCVTEDRAAGDQEVALVTGALRNVGAFTELDVADEELVVPPEWRVFAAPTVLAADQV